MTRRAFTLLEIIIAIGIFALIAGALLLFSSGVTDSWRRMSVEKNRFQEKITMDRAIDGILSNAIPFLWRDPAEETLVQKPFMIAEAQGLRIATMHSLHDSREGAIRFCEFSLDEESRLVVTNTDRPFMEWSDVPPSRVFTSVLATEVEDISFQYADWSTDTVLGWEEKMFWTTEWETEDSGRTDIPLAILLRVRWKDGREESWLRRTMGNSYRERFGTYEPPVENTEKQ